MGDLKIVTGGILYDILDFVIKHFEDVLGYHHIPWAVKEEDLPNIDAPVFYLSGTNQLERTYNSGYQAACRDLINLKVLYQIKNREPVEARKNIIEECDRVETVFIKDAKSGNFAFTNFSKSIDIHHDNYFMVTVELEVAYEHSL